jgi:hypothetical protein
MRYIYNDVAVIMVVEDDSATIRTTNHVVSYATVEEAIEFFNENGIDSTLLTQNA